MSISQTAQDALTDEVNDMYDAFQGVKGYVVIEQVGRFIAHVNVLVERGEIDKIALDNVINEQVAELKKA